MGEQLASSGSASTPAWPSSTPSSRFGSCQASKSGSRRSRRMKTLRIPTISKKSSLKKRQRKVARSSSATSSGNGSEFELCLRVSTDYLKGNRSFKWTYRKRSYAIQLQKVDLTANLPVQNEQ